MSPKIIYWYWRRFAVCHGNTITRKLARYIAKHAILYWRNYE